MYYVAGEITLYTINVTFLSMFSYSRNSQHNNVWIARNSLSLSIGAQYRGTRAARQGTELGAPESRQKVITGAGDWEGVRSLPSGLDGLGERRRMFPQLGREKNTGRKRILVNF